MIEKKVVKLSVFSKIPVRADRYLSTLFSIPRDYVKSLFVNDLITVNDHLVKPSFKLTHQDVINIEFVFESRSIETESIIDVNVNFIKTNRFMIPIIFQDDDLLVLNKPAGLLVHEAKSSRNDNLVDILKRANIHLFETADHRAGVVHDWIIIQRVSLSC